jgi:hypothetical protein
MNGFCCTPSTEAFDFSTMAKSRHRMCHVSSVASGSFYDGAVSLSYGMMCAVQRHGLPVGANPTRQLSLQPVAIGAVAEVTKRLKPSV